MAPDHPFGSTKLLALLSLIMATAAFATDMYLPAFPAIRAAFAVSPEAVQFSLSIFLYGNAMGQLLFGPLSDRYGRRPVLLVGLMTYVIATFGCALATDIGGFIAYRFFQGAAAASGPVLVRALINDRLGRAQAARTLGSLTGMMAFAAMLTPIAGGWLIRYLSWHWIFYTIGTIGVVLLIAAFFGAQETLPPARRLRSLGPTDVLKGYLAVAATPKFWIYVAPPSLMFTAVFAYVVVNSFLLIDALGMASQYYGMAYATAAFAFVIGSFTSNRLVARVGIERAIMVGIGGGIGTALAAVAASAQLTLSIALVVLPGLCMFFATALMLPVALSAAVSQFPERAGTASAVAGFTQLTFAAVGSAMAARLVENSALPLHLFMLGCSVLAALVWVGGARLRR